MEDTVDLRQLIEELLRGKWIIAGVTLVAMLVSGVVSFFVLEPTYEATTTLLVNMPKKAQAATSPGLAAVLEDLASSPQTSLETLRLQVTNPAVLSKVIADLQVGYTPEELAGRIAARVPKDTTLLAITVKDTNPKLAATVANTLVEHFTEHVERLNKGHLQVTSKFLEQQLQTENEKLNEATAKLKAFLQQPSGTEELSREQAAKLNLLTNYEAQRVQLLVELDATRAEVGAAERLVKALSPKLTTSRVVADDPVMYQLATSGQGDAAAVAGLRMESEEVNEAWMEASKLLTVKSVELARLEAELGSLDPVIARTQKELESIRTALVDKQTVQQQLEYQVELSNSAIRMLSQKQQENSISESARIAETGVTVVSTALPPEKPVAPRKLMNVAVAAVLGLMLGAGYVLFVNYWRSGASQGPAAS